MVGSVLSGVKISAAVATNRTTTGTIYTVPANCFLIFQVSYQGDNTETAAVNVGGQTVINFTGGATGSIPTAHIVAGGSGGLGICGPFFAGPSQNIELAGVIGSINVGISGVLFINTP